MPLTRPLSYSISSAGLPPTLFSVFPGDRGQAGHLEIFPSALKLSAEAFIVDEMALRTSTTTFVTGSQRFSG